MMIKKPVFMMLAMIFPMVCGAVEAEDNIEEPLWELGAGFGGISLPQYMGSDERYAIPFAFPYIIYRGEKWRIDRSGIKNKLVNVDKFTLELSLSGGLPVRNDNQARAGMPELFLNAEIGGKLNWYLSESAEESWILRFPLRAVVDVKGEYLGWVSNPVLTHKQFYPVEHGYLKTYLDVGFQYNSALYHETYYGVDAQYVTPNRAAYQAKAGLHSVYAKMWVRYPWSKKVELFATLQARSLAAGVVSDSPLVKDKTYATITLGAVWLFATSDEMVQQRND